MGGKNHQVGAMTEDELNDTVDRIVVSDLDLADGDSRAGLDVIDRGARWQYAPTEECLTHVRKLLPLLIIVRRADMQQIKAAAIEQRQSQGVIKSGRTSG